MDVRNLGLPSRQETDHAFKAATQTDPVNQVEVGPTSYRYLDREAGEMAALKLLKFLEEAGHEFDSNTKHALRIFGGAVGSLTLKNVLDPNANEGGITVRYKESSGFSQSDAVRLMALQHPGSVEIQQATEDPV